MRILGIKPGHDGTLATVHGGKLESVYEAEKGGRPRHSYLNALDFFEFLSLQTSEPDVIAIGGWYPNPISRHFPLVNEIESGYTGLERGRFLDKMLFGRKKQVFFSSHERSHILCSYGLSNHEQGTPCYALVWEGEIGKFYYINEKLEIKDLGGPMQYPGLRYEFLYSIADNQQIPIAHPKNAANPGKLMALASYGDSNACSPEDARLISFLLSEAGLSYIKTLAKTGHRKLPFANEIVNSGVETQRFKNLARAFSDALYDRFYNYASNLIIKGKPLLLGGGCALNCEWNTQWLDSNLFTDVFVPPCANDSGSAVGTAIDAQFSISGRAKVSWSPYCGSTPSEPTQLLGFMVQAAEAKAVVDLLVRGAVIAWAKGRCELGPRALGNRSLLCAPFNASARDRLNRIKGRENFRPVAPICIEEEAALHFATRRPSPYMLFFSKVLNPCLQAITHVDGTARLQTVSREQNGAIYDVLSGFGKLTGASVLCNTSLNTKGCGFLNEGNDILQFIKRNKIEAAVINDKLYINPIF